MRRYLKYTCQKCLTLLMTGTNILKWCQMSSYQPLSDPRGTDSVSRAQTYMHSIRNAREVFKLLDHNVIDTAARWLEHFRKGVKHQNSIN